MAEEEAVATERGQRRAEAEGSWRLLPELLRPIFRPLPPRAKDPALSSVGEAHSSSARDSWRWEEERRAPWNRAARQTFGASSHRHTDVRHGSFSQEP